MRRTLVLLGFVVGLIAACSGSSATGSLPAGGTPGATQAGATSTGAGATGAGATGSPTTGAPKTLDACSLITAAEAAAALGKPVDPGAVPEPGAHSCIFPDAAVSTDSVEISLTSVADFKPTQKSIPGLTITQVSGIGDDAYYVSGGTGLIVLNVRKGQTTFTTSVLLKSASDSALMAGEKTLAMAVLGRI
jgi:hypothetical protein